MPDKPERAPISAHLAVTPPAEPSWMQTRSILRVLLIILASVLAVGAVLWILYKLTGVILLLILAIFFAYLVAPLVEFVHRPIKIAGRERIMPRALAIGIVYVVLFGSLGVVVYLLIPKLGAQLPAFAEQAREYWRKLSDSTRTLNEISRRYRIPPSVVEAINSTIPRVADTAAEYARVAVEGAIGSLTYLPWLLLIPILAFFFLKDAESFRRSALHMLPSGRWRWRGDEFFQDVNSTLAAYIRAQLTACLLIGFISGIAFGIFGLPNAVVLGALAGLLEFIPLAGPLGMAIIVVLIAGFHGGFTFALLVLLFLAVLRIVEDYVIYPRIIGQGIHLHPLAVILAILCGAELAGVAGIFLAIPVIAIITVSYRHWMEHRGSEGLADLLQPEDPIVTESTPPPVPAVTVKTKPLPSGLL